MQSCPAAPTKALCPKLSHSCKKCRYHDIDARRYLAGDGLFPQHQTDTRLSFRRPALAIHPCRARIAYVAARRHRADQPAGGTAWRAALQPNQTRCVAEHCGAGIAADHGRHRGRVRDAAVRQRRIGYRSAGQGTAGGASFGGSLAAANRAEDFSQSPSRRRGRDLGCRGRGDHRHGQE